MRGIIDRFEGQYAVVELEDGKLVNICKNSISVRAKEGTALVINGDTVSIDQEETRRLYEKTKALEDELWK